MGKNTHTPLSRTIKGLRFCPTFKLTTESTTVSQMLAEDKRLLGQIQKKKKPYYSQYSNQPEHQHIPCWFPKLQFPQDTTNRASENLLTEEVALQERNPMLREPESFLMSSEDAYTLF